MNHTPAPWECKSSNSERFSQYIAPVNLKSWPYDVIAYIPEAYGDKCTFPGTHISNAKLIAAAPELLAALQSAYQHINGGSGIKQGMEWKAMHDQIRAAIAKAGGAA